MNSFLILSCSSNLGSCCKSSVMSSILGIVNNLLSIIQILVPILLLVMVCINLAQLMINPEEKKLLKSILNKTLAAVIVFFIPIFINAGMNIISDNTSNNFDFLACLKESKNIKINSNVKYTSTKTEDERKPILPDSGGYEEGKPIENNSGGGTSDSNITLGEKITPGDAVIGDSGVRLVPNDSHRKAAITHKANNMDVVNYAKSWLGQGLTYKLGSSQDLRPGGTCDCSHFVYKVLKHFGIIEGGQIRTTVWGSGNVKGTILYSDVSKIIPGDVLFNYFGGTSAHVEIYIGGNESIGCNSGRGVTHGHRANKYRTFIHLTAYD